MRHLATYLATFTMFLFLQNSSAQNTDSKNAMKIAQSAYDRSNYALAEKLYLEELATKSNDSESLDTTRASCLLGLGQTYNQTHEYQLAIDRSMQALEIYEKICNDTFRPMCISCYNNIGYSYSKLAELETSVEKKEELYEQSIGFYNVALDASQKDDNKELATAYYNLVAALIGMEEYTEALDYCEKCENLFKEEESIQEGLSKVYSAKATIYYYLGRRNAQMALDTLKELYPDSHPAFRRAKRDLERFK